MIEFYQNALRHSNTIYISIFFLILGIALNRFRLYRQKKNEKQAKKTDKQKRPNKKKKRWIVVTIIAKVLMFLGISSMLIEMVGIYLLYDKYNDIAENCIPISNKLQEPPVRITFICSEKDSEDKDKKQKYYIETTLARFYQVYQLEDHLKNKCTDFKKTLDDKGKEYVSATCGGINFTYKTWKP